MVAKTKMASRGAVGKSQLWCRKLDTRTSSMVMWAVGRGLREVTAAQVAGGSGRLTGGSCVGRVWCAARAEARGGGEPSSLKLLLVGVGSTE